MTRRSETVWWLCVCATLATLTAVVAYDWGTASPNAQRAIVGSTPVRRPPLAEFQQAFELEHPTKRKAQQLLAIASASVTEVQEMIEQLVAGSEPPKLEAAMDLDLLSHALHRYTSLDPEGALQFMLATPEAKQHSHMVFHNWGRLNFSAARQAVDSLPPKQRRRAAISLLEANTRVRLNLFASYQHSLNLPDTNPAFERWAHEQIITNPQQAWVSVLEHGGKHYAHQYLAAWMQRDADAALQALESANFSFSERSIAFSQIAHHNPRRALDWLDETNDVEHLHSQSVDLLGELAAIAPKDAWQRSTQLQHTYQLPAQANILAVWGDHQPDQAVQWLLRYGDTSQLQSTLGQLTVRQHTKLAAYDLLRFIDDVQVLRYTTEQLQQRWPE